MASPAIFILGTVIVYLLILAGIGEYARRRTNSTREDFFMGNRAFKTVALLFSLLATFLTAFVIIGAPSLAYREGIGAYGYFAGAATLIVPTILATIGYRLWLAGKKFGHITPGQFVNHRYGTEHLGAALMGFLIFWTVPYLLLGAIGSGLTFSALTQGKIPYAAGVAIPLIVVFLYVIGGGMRGTTWTNMFQGALLITLLLGFMTYLGIEFGGFASATQATLQHAPELATRSGSTEFTPKMWFSFALMIAFAVPMFPQMFIRILTGASVDTYKRMVVLFGAGIMLVAMPVILLGFWGAGQMPGLVGQEADKIFPMLIGKNTPPAFIGFGIIMIFAAIMSTLDAQTLSISTMLSEDLIRPYKKNIQEQREVFLARILTGLVLLIVFLTSLFQPGTVFWIAEFAFQGYALLFYPALAGLYWYRMNGYGAWAGIFLGFIGLWLFQLGVLPTWLTAGFMPLIPLLILQIVVVHAVSRMTERVPEERVTAYKDLYNGIW